MVETPPEPEVPDSEVDVPQLIEKMREISTKTQAIIAENVANIREGFAQLEQEERGNK